MASLVDGGLVPDPSYWRGKRVFLTGHSGFKGAWLLVWLLEMGAQVTGYSRDIPTNPNLFEDLRLGDAVDDQRGDIRDLSALEAAIRRAKPDVILHLAAQALVRYSYDEPVETFETNVMGTVNVLEAARRMPGEKVVLIVTSDKCYENRERIWGYREFEAMGGHDPYSSSKGCAELVTSAYARSFAGESGDLKIASARAGNVIGGGDWALDRLVPDIIRGLQNGQSVPIRNPSAIRPWQHVLEPLCGYLVLCEAVAAGKGAGEGWNFGPEPDSEATVHVVANLVCEAASKRDGWHFAGVPGQIHEARLLRLDATKARVELGWRPRWSLAEAVAATVEVYQSGLTGRDLRALLRRQIASYSGRHA